MELTLELKQTQKLSPQAIQSMAILQMGTQELQAHVEKALLENPTLELEQEERMAERPELLGKMDWLMSNDRQNRWYHREDVQNLAEYVAASDEESLYDHLRGQLDPERLPPRLQIAVDCVLAGLNGSGYLEETTEEMSARCGQSVAIVQQAEQLVKTLEPAGVAARTLSECLSLQLKQKGEFSLALTIAEHHLEDMAQNHYSRIAKKTGASREEIQEACRQIRALNPKPGAQFAPREAPGYIIPDLLVTEENGRLTVTLGDDFLPVLKVSAYYQKLMRDTSEPEVKEYLEEKVRQAVTMVKSIEQRKSTLLNCAQIIVAKQEAFFHHGSGHIQPLTLVDVAKEMGVHESTVSRAIRAKYLQCARGTFPLSHFFSRSLQAGDGEVSPEQVKTIIQALIGREDRKRPLSDQKICDSLAEQKIFLSRRTVAKYRDEMGIPPASGRKEF